MKHQFGIIGYGRMAEICHKPLIESLPNVQLSAVYDPTPARRLEAEKQGYCVYDKLNAFFKHPDLEAVAVVTPSVTHHDIVLKALQAGKHVIVEKPMAMNAKEAGEMIQTARKYKKILTVFHNRRFDTDYLTVKKIIQSGKLGKILAIESRIQGWGSAAGFGIATFYQNWRNEKKWGGGGLYDWGSHLIDQMQMMVKSPVASVTANLQKGNFAKDCDDYAMGMIRFENGINGLIEVNYMTKYPLPRWRVMGEKGTLINELSNWNEITYFDPSGNLEMHIPVEKGDPKVIYQSFLKSIQGKGKPVVDPEAVLKTMQIIDAFFASSKKGESIHF
jgi:scyllo-inositol 2-dehydrogenase (NADP+)